MIQRFFQPAGRVGRKTAIEAITTIREDIALDLKHFYGNDRLDCLDLLALSGIAEVSKNAGIWSIKIEGIMSTGNSRHAAMDNWIEIEEQSQSGIPNAQRLRVWLHSIESEAAQ